MDFLWGIAQVILRGLLAIIVLFFLTKLMGVKQISQLSLFDYIIGISIGSIAAELACDTTMEFMDAVLAMITFSLAALFVSVITNKSIKARRFFTGVPLVVIDNGKLIRENLRTAKYDVCELQSELRGQGYFDMAQVNFAVLETNGKVSILPKAQYRPVTPCDLKLAPQEEALVANVILDGKLMPQNLKAMGKNEQWLEAQLKQHKIDGIENILLGTCDKNDKFTAYFKGEDVSRKGILI